MKYAGEYWCYCTGVQPDGGAFGVLHSRDLVVWRELGSALARLPAGTLTVPDTCYWAPETVYLNGRFYLYYSVGNETHMEIRVAVAEQPAGPFVDSGHALTHAEFAIDGHVFRDDDGTRYLFYATDFLTHSHIGTGTVVDRVLDPFTLAGQPRPVTRARYDWQVYDPQRREKGGVRWHTLEGPFVLKRKGRYYQMFSGGNWQNVTYGVSYATSPTVEREDEWEQASDGERVMPILRTLPDAGVIGPGHNSVVRGPDNRQLFCIYHRWARDIEARVLAIDRLEWVGEAMRVLGPTTTPQPAPNGPAMAGFQAETEAGLRPEWQISGGQWRVREGRAELRASEGTATAQQRLPAANFRLEVTLAPVPGQGDAGQGVFGIELRSEAGLQLRVTFIPGERVVLVETGAGAQRLAPEDFDFSAPHLLRLDVNAGQACLSLDEGAVDWQGALGSADGQPPSLAFFARAGAAAFAGLSVTAGWEDDFSTGLDDPLAIGWQSLSPEGRWTIAGQELWQTQPTAAGALVVKGEPLRAYELVINVRLDKLANAGNGPEGYGLYPVYTDEDPGPLLTVEPAADGWRLAWRPGTAPDKLTTVEVALNGAHEFPLPAGFDPYVYQQFRFRRQNGQVSIQWAGEHLGGIQAPAPPARAGLYAHRAAVAFDLVRMTALG